MSDEESAWEATKEYSRELLENLRENWDESLETVAEFARDVREWHERQWDYIRDGSDDRGND